MSRRIARTRARLGLLLGAALALAGPLGAPPPAAAVSPSVVISQVYGGGGNAGGTLRNDFIELYNRGAATVGLAGWTVQYASSAASTRSATSAPGRTARRSPRG